MLHFRLQSRERDCCRDGEEEIVRGVKRRCLDTSIFLYVHLVMAPIVLPNITSVDQRGRVREGGHNLILAFDKL